jgi:hypothetical protein
MKFFFHPFRILYLLIAAAALVVSSGCGTVEGDSQNASSRPWNTPTRWETGMPMGIGDQYR